MPADASLGQLSHSPSASACQGGVLAETLSSPLFSS